MVGRRWLVRVIAASPLALVLGVACSKAVTSGSDAGKGDATLSFDAAANDALADTAFEDVLPEGAVVLSGPFPSCTWPADLNPPPSEQPDGAPGSGSGSFDPAGWTLTRSYIVCGCSGNEACTVCPSDDGATCIGPDPGPGAAPCELGCAPNTYAVTFRVEYSDDGAPIDAGLIEPNLPAGCGPLLPTAAAVISNAEFTETPNVMCCPCVPAGGSG